MSWRDGSLFNGTYYFAEDLSSIPITHMWQLRKLVAQLSEAPIALASSGS